MQAGYRLPALIGILAVLAACGDGRGSQYSSQRAVTATQSAAASYVAVTPGAQPVQTTTASANLAPARLTQPIAITPGAQPIYGSTPTPPAGVAATAPLPTQAAMALTAPRAPLPQSRRFATGPIYAACRAAGRKNATEARCGCVQWVADRELSSSDQRRGARYFSQQHALQEVRMSDRPSDEVFWDTWKAYGQSATRYCSGT